MFAFRSGSANAKLSKLERFYAEEMEIAARMKTTFLDGEPVVALFPKDKTMWLTYGGIWGMNGEFAYVARSSYKGSGPLAWNVPVPGEFRIDCEIAPHGTPKDWSFVFYQMPDDPKIVRQERYPYFRMAVVTNQCKAAFGRWDEVEDFTGGVQATFPFDGVKVGLSIVYTAEKVSVYANGSEKPLIETADYGKMLEAIKTGRLRFNGTSVRLHSLRVSCPKPIRH